MAVQLWRAADNLSDRYLIVVDTNSLSKDELRSVYPVSLGAEHVMDG